MAKKVTDKDKKTVNKVVNAYNTASSARSSLESKWDRYYKLFRAHTEGTPDDSRSNLNIPYIFAQVEAAVPKIVNNLFAAKPYIGVMPMRGDSVEKAKALEMLIDYQVGHILKMPIQMLKIVKECLVYGTAIMKVTWRFEVAEKKTRLPEMDELGNVISREERTVPYVKYDDPNVEHIDLYDFYIDPAATSIEKAKYCIHRVMRSPEYIEARMEEGIYKKFPVDKLRGGAEGTDFRQQRLDNVGVGSGVGAEDNRIELLEYWEDDRVIVVANQKVLLRDEETPFWHNRKPFVSVNLIPVMHEFYGMSYPEIMEHLHAELNTLRNQRRDNVSLVINRMWRKLKMADIDTTQLRSRPGGVIEVDSMDDLAPLDMPDVTSSAYREEGVIKQDLDMVTGISDHARGTETSRKETATQASILSAAANERFKAAIMLACESLNELGRMLIDLNQQYMDSSRVVRITGIDGVHFEEISPEDIDGKYEVYPAGSSTEPQVSREIKQAQYLQLFQTLANNPIVDQQKLVKALLDVFGVKDANTFFVQQQMMPPAADPMAMQGQMGGMPQEGGIPPEMMQMMGGMMQGG